MNINKLELKPLEDQYTTYDSTGRLVSTEWPPGPPNVDDGSAEADDAQR